MEGDTKPGTINTGLLAHMLVAERRKIEGECRVCSKRITSVSFRCDVAHLYCSENCRKVAYRTHNPEASQEVDVADRPPNVYGR